MSGTVRGRFGAAIRGRRPGLRLGPVHVRGLQRPGPDIHDGFPDRVHVTICVRGENAGCGGGPRRPSHVVVGMARQLVSVRRRPVPVALVPARPEIRHRHDRRRRGHVRRHDRATSARPRYAAFHSRVVRRPEKRSIVSRLENLENQSFVALMLDEEKFRFQLTYLDKCVSFRGDFFSNSPKRIPNHLTTLVATPRSISDNPPCKSASQWHVEFEYERMLNPIFFY